MQLPLSHIDPPLAMDMANQHSTSVHEPVVQPSASREEHSLALPPEEDAPPLILAPDSEAGIEYDANDWVGLPPHPSEFVRPPPQQPVYYVVTIGEEAGIYDNTWAETFDIRRISRLELFSMRTFRDWDQAHRYYTDVYNQNRIANTPNSSLGAPSLPPSVQVPSTTTPDPVRQFHRAQSAPAVIPSVLTRRNGNPQTPRRVAPAPRHGSVESGSPSHPFYVASTFPTPVVSRAARPVVFQPAPPVKPVSVLAPIPEHEPARPRVLMTQLYFDRTGCLINPAATVAPSTANAATVAPSTENAATVAPSTAKMISSAAISVPSSPEDNIPPPPPAPARCPQPFPLVVDPDLFSNTPRAPVPRGTPSIDPDFFARPSQASVPRGTPSIDPDFFAHRSQASIPRGTPSGAVALTPARETSVLSSAKSVGIPDTPFLNTPTRSRPFPNLFPNDNNSTVKKDKKTRLPVSQSDSNGMEDWARLLFRDELVRTSAPKSSRKIDSPVASSSNASKTSRKRRSPTTPTSKPVKTRKTTSKGSKSRADPTPDDGYDSDSMYLPDP